MKLRALLLLLTVGYANVRAQSAQHILNDVIIDNNIPGLQLAYTIKGKSTYYNAGVGKAGVDKKINQNTIFRAGSLGKSVFAYAVLRLCDRGVLSLDKPLMQYTGTYKRFDPKDPRYSMITARMVLSHTSGLAEFPQFETGDPVKLLFAPGSSFAYSGEGYWFLQKVVETITAKPFEQLMQEEVFKPLGMQSSSYVQTDRMDAVMLGGVDPDLAAMSPNAAFTLLTNAHDYNLFLQALLAGKGLMPATQKRMFAKQSNAQWYGKDTTAADQYIDWGLGVGLQQNEKGNAIWHWGSTGNFFSFYVAFPATGQSLVFFIQAEHGLKITDQLINVFLGKQTTQAMRWLRLGYDHPETMVKLTNAFRLGEFENVPAVFKRLKSSGWQFSEKDLNWYGLGLLKQSRSKEALAVFQQTIKLYPQSPFAIANYAAAAEANSDNQLAIKSYRQSLSLDAGNESARNHIKALENAKQFGSLIDFAGKYNNPDKPGISVTFEAKANKLVLTQSWDGGQLEFFQTGGMDFYNEEPGFSLKFEKGADGRVVRYFMNGIKVGWVRE